MAICVILAIALSASFLASCTTTGGGAASPGVARFCELWDEVAAEEPPTPDNPVLVKDGVVAAAEETNRVGGSCTAPNAKVLMDDALIAEGGLVPAEEGPSAPMEVAVTGDQLAQGQAVFENLAITGFSIEIGLQGITVRGTVSITLSGATSNLSFSGTLANLNAWSITLSSTNMHIPGLTLSPVSFSGTINSVNGVRSLLLSANAPGPVIQTGDILVSNAHVHVRADDQTGLEAEVEGTVDVGPSSAFGEVEVKFDRVGTLLSAKVDVDAHLEGISPTGEPVMLEGNLKFEGNEADSTAWFSATGHIGPATVHEAAGQIHIVNSNVATFDGVIEVQQGVQSVRVAASIVFNGGVATPDFSNIPDLSALFALLNDGSVVEVDADVNMVVDPNGQWSGVIDGDILVGTTHIQGLFNIVTDDDVSTVTMVPGQASVVGAGFNASVSGTIVFDDGTATTVDLTMAIIGNAVLGDLTVTNGNLRLTSSGGGPLTAVINGTVVSGDTVTLTGALTAVLGPNGELLSLTGTANGELDLEGWVAAFQGTVNATGDVLTITGTGAISNPTNIPITVPFSGTYTSSLSDPTTWTLVGDGKLTLGTHIHLVGARFKLTSVQGMQAVRVGVYLPVLGIKRFFEIDVALKPNGGCQSIDVVGGAFLARLLLTPILPSLVSCDTYL